MRILNKWTKAVALAAVFAVATTVAAQTTHHVSSSKIGWGAWTFKPIYADAAAGPQVHSFLVSAPPDVTVGDNIVAVWYVRDPSAPGGWIAKSWETTSRAEVVKSVKTALGISDAEDDRWEFAEKSEIDAVLSPEQSKNYDRGLLADDPFAALLAASPDRDEVVAAIASWGYKAADVNADKGLASCSSGAVLSAFAAATEAGLTECESMDKTVVTLVALSTALGGTCPDGLAALGADATFYVASIPESTCDRPNVLPIPPWSPVRCTTERGLFPNSTKYCWTYERTYTVTRTKTLGALNPLAPPTYLFCTQTSTATRKDTRICCSPWYPDPVPGRNPNCEDLLTPVPTPGSPGAPTCFTAANSPSYPLQGPWTPNPCTPWVP